MEFIHKSIFLSKSMTYWRSSSRKAFLFKTFNLLRLNLGHAMKIIILQAHNFQTKSIVKIIWSLDKMKMMMMNINLRGKYRKLNTNEWPNECNLYAKRVTIINTRSMYCLYERNHIKGNWPFYYFWIDFK